MKYDGKINHVAITPWIWSNPSGSVTVRLDAEKGVIKSATVFFCSKHKMGIRKELKKAKMVPYLSNSYRETFIGEMNMDDRRFAYYFLFTDSEGKRYLYGSMGVMEEDDVNFTTDCYFQYCYVFKNEASIVPGLAKKKGAVVQIFPDRFAIGNLVKPCMKDVNLKPGEKPTPRSFYGGDLKGIEDKISYLNNMGISTIYLTPIFKSSSNHRYDTEDYLHVDDRLGGDQALTSLVKKAHSYNMKVVLDGVFNHCSFRHPYFQDVLKNGKDSKYYSYFIIQGNKPDVEKGNYERFGWANYMPKFDTSNPEVINDLVSQCVDVTKRFEIDGWRFDVADEISHDFWRAMHKALRAIDPDMILEAEDWLASENYLGYDQMDGTMNYQLRDIILSIVASAKPFKPQQAADRLVDLLLRYTWPSDLSMFNLVSSHDTPRLFTLTNCNADKTLLGVALAVIFPGLFMSYYGDERKMEGGPDPDNRRPVDWNNANLDQDYFNKYSDLLKIKKLSPTITGGFNATVENNILFIERKADDGKSVVLACNITDKRVHKTLTKSRTDVCMNNFDGKWEFGPYGYVFYTLC